MLRRLATATPKVLTYRSGTLVSHRAHSSMRAALDTVRMELETTSRTHSDLSNMVRNDLEGGVGDFAGRTGQARKNVSSPSASVVLGQTPRRLPRRLRHLTA